MHNPGALFPILIAPLIIGLGMWNSLRMRRVFRLNGRKAVEAELARRGEQAVAIEDVPIHTVHERAGLSAACIFRIVSRTADGVEQVHMWAYRPGLAGRRPRGLQHLSHGIWIAMA